MERKDERIEKEKEKEKEKKKKRVSLSLSWKKLLLFLEIELLFQAICRDFFSSSPFYFYFFFLLRAFFSPFSKRHFKRKVGILFRCATFSRRSFLREFLFWIWPFFFLLISLEVLPIFLQLSIWEWKIVIVTIRSLSQYEEERIFLNGNERM